MYACFNRLMQTFLIWSYYKADDSHANNFKMQILRKSDYRVCELNTICNDFTHALVNLGTRKFSFSINYTSLNVWVRYFVWNSKWNLWNSIQNILPIHWMTRLSYLFPTARYLHTVSVFNHGITCRNPLCWINATLYLSLQRGELGTTNTLQPALLLVKCLWIPRYTMRPLGNI